MKELLVFPAGQPAQPQSRYFRIKPAVMRYLLIVTLVLLYSFSAIAANVHGVVSDDQSRPLAFASVFVKGSTVGTTSNNEGQYRLRLNPGNYTIVVQFVGYERVEKQVTVSEEDVQLDFILSVQQLTLDEVIVSKGEDPAYEIIRQAIRKREFYHEQVDSFRVNVYIKGLLRSRSIPDRFFGQPIDKKDLEKQGVDSTGKGILYLSESLTQVAYKRPDKIKMEVLSARESGGGFGFSFPFFTDFYQNNVALFRGMLNKRGFISPIADNAFHYYRFKYEGSFYEDGKAVNRIRVIPKRKYEPLFAGLILITDDDWRIHSLDLITTADNELELMDTLEVKQVHVPVTRDIWRVKDQVMHMAFKKFGFDVVGNFVNVYEDYELQPDFRKKYFDRVLMQYDSSFNKKDSAWWSRMRPVPLEHDEQKDFVVKDSLAQIERDSAFSKSVRDSLRRNQSRLSIKSILWTKDASHSYYGKNGTLTWKMDPLIKQLEYNTVEGLVVQLNQRLEWLPKNGGHLYSFGIDSRYGFSNTHLNARGWWKLSEAKPSFRNRYLIFSGGKRISQFNKDKPINAITNSLYTLLGKRNYAKYYENWFVEAAYHNRFASGVELSLKGTWENRIPVYNTTNFSFFNKDDVFLPNHPYELASIDFEKQRAVIASASLSYQPGQLYILFPDGRQPVGSNAPVFSIDFDQGWVSKTGKTEPFSKWKFSISDNVNAKLWGELKYKLSAGGFFHGNDVQIPDLQHFNGNRTFYNIKYLNSFQLAEYYRYSTSEKLWGLAHLEQHFNGLLSNKIPLFNRLKWSLVAGSNLLYINRNNYYVEGFAGLENIFKLFRLDFVTAWQPGAGNTYGIRVGLGGVIGGMMRVNSD